MSIESQITALEKQILIRKFTSDLYQNVDIECRQMVKVFDFAEEFINNMKEESGE